MEIAKTTVSGRLAASLLNLRTDVAQTLVSKLGKIFNITFFPFKSFKKKEERSEEPFMEKLQTEIMEGKSVSILNR